jgi:hypothetical protein
MVIDNSVYELDNDKKKITTNKENNEYFINRIGSIDENGEFTAAESSKQINFETFIKELLSSNIITNKGQCDNLTRKVKFSDDSAENYNLGYSQIMVPCEDILYPDILYPEKAQLLRENNLTDNIVKMLKTVGIKKNIFTEECLHKEDRKFYEYDKINLKLDSSTEDIVNAIKTHRDKKKLMIKFGHGDNGHNCIMVINENKIFGGRKTKRRKTMKKRRKTMKKRRRRRN